MTTIQAPDPKNLLQRAYQLLLDAFVEQDDNGESIRYQELRRESESVLGQWRAVKRHGE